MIDFTKRGSTFTPELTPEIAQNACNLIIKHGNADLAFKNQQDSAIDPEHFILVDKEIERIVKGINIIMTQNTDITENELKSRLSSNLLDTDLVYTAYKGEKSWDQFKALYNESAI